jgi:hypothetical protein
MKSQSSKKQALENIVRQFINDQAGKANNNLKKYLEELKKIKEETDSNQK